MGIHGKILGMSWKFHGIYWEHGKQIMRILGYHLLGVAVHVMSMGIAM